MIKFIFRFLFGTPAGRRRMISEPLFMDDDEDGSTEYDHYRYGYVPRYDLNGRPIPLPNPLGSNPHRPWECPEQTRLY